MRQQPTSRSRRAWSVLAGALAITLVAGACSGGAPGADDQESGPPQPGGSITVGLESESDSLLPGSATFPASTRNVAMTIFDPLMARTTDGKVEPFLAESLTPNDELTEWTMKLRPGVTFHDGTDLDAQALKTIFDEFLIAESSTVRGDLTDAGKPVTVEIVDDLTVKYVLPRPNSAFPASPPKRAGRSHPPRLKRRVRTPAPSPRAPARSRSTRGGVTTG